MKMQLLLIGLVCLWLLKAAEVADTSVPTQENVIPIGAH
jgi:hypothetical protein